MKEIIETTIVIVKSLWGVVMWISRRLRLVKQEKKEAERDVTVWFEKYKDSLKQQLKKETDTKKRQALEDELKQLDAGERAYYKEMLERTLERSGLPAYGKLVAKGRDEPMLEPENKVKLTEAVTHLDVLPPLSTAYEFMASAIANYVLERYEEALAYCNQALKLKPDDQIVLNNRGCIYDKLGRHKEAIADYNKALKLMPNDPIIISNRGGAYSDMARYNKALADYNRSLELIPDDPITVYNKGLVYYRIKQYEKALADYNKAIKLRQDYPEAINNRGATYLKLGRYDAALADFNRVLRLKPDDAGAVYNKACFFSLNNKPNDAISYLEKATALDDKLRKYAAKDTDRDFDNIRDDPRFKKLIAGD